MGNLLDPSLLRSTITWDQETGTFSGIFRCRSCGRFLGKFERARMGGYEAPPCRTKTCSGYINRIGFETFAPPAS